MYDFMLIGAIDLSFKKKKRRLGGPQSGFGRFGEDNYFLSLPNFKPTDSPV
jgi:hypothetical protein